MLLSLLLACNGITDLVVKSDTAIFIDDIVDTGQDLPACLDEGVRATLEEWLYQSWLVAYGSPASASPSSVVAAYQLPGVAASPWFSLTLASACDAPHDLDPVCTGGVCYQVECTGAGGEWIDHIENDPDGTGEDATTFDGWVVDRGRVPISWSENDGLLTLTYDVKALTAPDGADWTFSGMGWMDGQLDLDVTFPAIYADGPVIVTVTNDVGGVMFEGSTIATWEGQQLTLPERCTP